MSGDRVQWCPVHGKDTTWTGRSDGLYGGPACDHCFECDECPRVQFSINDDVVVAIENAAVERERVRIMDFVAAGP